MSHPIANIRFHSGNDQGKVVPIFETPFTIGRLPDNHLVIAEKYVSRHHVQIDQRSDGTFVIRGLSKRNPIKVNEAPIKKSDLSGGDKITICDLELMFEDTGGEQVPVLSDEGEEEGDFNDSSGNSPPGQFVFDDGSSDDVGDNGDGAPGLIPIDDTEDPEEEELPPEDFDQEEDPPKLEIADPETDEIDPGDADDLDDHDFVDADELAILDKQDNDGFVNDPMTRNLLFLGLGATVVAIILIALIMNSGKSNTFKHDKIEVREGQTIRQEEIWHEPGVAVVEALLIRGVSGVITDGASLRAAGDRVQETRAVRVQWVYPVTSDKSYFVITGKTAGKKARLVFRYQNGDQTILPIVVSGKSEKIEELDRFRNDLAAKTLAQKLEDGWALIRRADALWDARTRHEDKYHEAIREYRKAHEVVEAIDLKGFNDSYNKLRERDSTNIEKAELEWSALYDRLFKKFSDASQSGSRDRAEAFLERLFDVVGERDDPRYEELLIYQEILF